MTDTPKPPYNPAKWQAEEKYPELCQKLRAALGEVYDPEIHLSIIQLGLVRDVTIRDDQAIIRMILTTLFCPYGPSLLESARVKAEEVLERPTAIDLGMEPWDISMMEEDLAADWGLF